jgi:hypothetical protein
MKKNLPLHRQTIKHEPAYYIFNNALAHFLCGHLHLLRQGIIIRARYVRYAKIGESPHGESLPSMQWVESPSKKMGAYKI